MLLDADKVQPRWWPWESFSVICWRKLAAKGPRMFPKTCYHPNNPVGHGCFLETFVWKDLNNAKMSIPITKNGLVVPQNKSHGLMRSHKSKFSWWYHKQWAVTRKGKSILVGGNYVIYSGQIVPLYKTVQGWNPKAWMSKPNGGDLELEGLDLEPKMLDLECWRRPGLGTLTKGWACNINEVEGLDRDDLKDRQG